jgi:outer membrane protein assembly factor BamB
VSGTVLYRANSERTALYAVEPVRAEPSVRWQVEVGEQVNTRLLAGEALFAATDSGALLALDAAMGDELWTINLSGPVIGAFAYADGTLFIGTRSQGLLAIDTSRIALWSSRVFAYRLSKSRRSAG